MDSFQSELIGTLIFAEIYDRSWRQINFNHFMENKFNQYCYDKSAKFSETIIKN